MPSCNTVVLVRRRSQVPGQRLRGGKSVEIFEHPHASAGIGCDVDNANLLTGR